MASICTTTAAAYPRATPREEMVLDSLADGVRTFLVIREGAKTELSTSSVRLAIDRTVGWLAVSRGRNELSITLEQPRQVIEMMASREPKGKVAGVTRTKHMAVAAPPKAKNRRSSLRSLPV